MRRAWLTTLSVVILMHLLVPAGRCQTPPAELQLTNAAAIAMAIRRNIEVQNESLSSFMAEIDLSRSWGIYNPVVSLSANSGITATPGEMFRTRNTLTTLGLTQYLPTGGSISATTQTGYTTAESDNPEQFTKDWQSSMGLTVSQPILRNAWKEATGFPIFAAEKSLDESFERFRSFLNDTVFTVSASYNRLFTLRQVLAARKDALESAEKFLDEIRRKVTSANPLAMEIADADFAVVQRRRELVEAERNVRDHEAGFRYLIGLEGKAIIVPVDPPSREEPPETEEQAVAAALSRRPDLLQLQTSLQVQQVQERIARGQVLPELNLSAGGGLSGTAPTIGKDWRDLFEGRRRFWTVGMQFSYPIGNTAAIDDYRRTRIRTEQLQNQIKSLSWRIRNDVESDMRSLISARLQLRMADRSLKLAEQRVDEYRKKVGTGAIKVQDVINAENDLTAARNAQTDAVETFANAVARLWRDMGTLLDRNAVKLDPKHPGKVVAAGPGEHAL
ncbi:TolC family protein [Geotalea sp. SG265]|uniref:TolC family protein n=1 Tax=Geotalea sp. SG265 TaxID=2922867 RepID=UPI001FAF8627|nr:TolC family protein [Geotalea sp. SG265]